MVLVVLLQSVLVVDPASVPVGTKRVEVGPKSRYLIGQLLERRTI